MVKNSKHEDLKLPLAYSKWNSAENDAWNEFQVISSKKLNHKNGERLDFITASENSKYKLLLAGKNGVIISLQYPIEDEPNLDFFLMHNRKITHVTSKP